ncbi:hypothetical protein BGZ63DRAFT_384735 [Mariannaea sp. PMI_226]|nr:hypothetical protein BGZ63DRAFT_384735 [Mariannaea sp. PMI_226]
MDHCKVCDEPLVIPLDADDADEPGSNDGKTVPDDLELQCGCHFHWQCLLDQSSSVILSLQCPSCATVLTASRAGSSSTSSALGLPAGASILVKYINEGGTQDNLDILPSIAEEAYLETHPEARPARALHVMCVEGDVLGIVELLRDLNDEIDDLGALICYQDPLADLKSGLHLAIENTQEDVAWLLLWLSSVVPETSFPESARQAALSMGIGRLQIEQDDDIRTLQDAQGRSALTLAQQLQSNWGEMITVMST